jgi:nucleotide-binding universal stress UspA family protein
LSELELLKQDKGEALPPFQHVEHQFLRHVLACVDTSLFADAVLAHAAAVAMAAGARVTVMRVLETPAVQAPTDPVEWAMRRRDVEADLRECASRSGDLQADAVVVDGSAAERICTWARANAVDLTVLGGGGEGNWPFVGLGGTARRVAEVVNGSVLLVPSTQVGDAPIRYRMVLTPLDGSSRSESALPLSLAIAAAHGAELVLVHAAPNVDLTEADTLEVEAIRLRDRLRRRNERAAERYLKLVRSRMPRTPATRIRVLPSGDPRHALARAAVEEHADLMVLSCTGQSGHPDMSVGSVADYLINHMDIPVLLVRGHEGSPSMVYRKSGEAMAVRLPSRALM